jgi:hypothetical protein
MLLEIKEKLILMSGNNAYQESGNKYIKSKEMRTIG